MKFLPLTPDHPESHAFTAGWPVPFTHSGNCSSGQWFAGCVEASSTRGFALALRPFHEVSHLIASSAGACGTHRFNSESPGNCSRNSLCTPDLSGRLFAAAGLRGCDFTEHENEKARRVDKTGRAWDRGDVPGLTLWVHAAPQRGLVMSRLALWLEP